MSDIQSLPFQDWQNRDRPNLEVLKISTPLYSVFGSDWFLFHFEVANRQAGDDLAGLFRKAIAQCSARAPKQSHAEAASPSLTDTLNFIVDKVNSQGKLTWVDTITDSAGTTVVSKSYDSEDTFYVGPTPCVLNIRDSHLTFTRRLSLRRIVNIEVLPWTDALPSLNATGQKHVVTPMMYSLVVHTPKNRALMFADESLADRIAKAMTHAAEICGAGANSEPF
jgi:hypothetical protein